MTLFIADDNRKFRQRLASVVSALESVDVVGQAGTVRNAVSAVARTQPDVLILDIQMPGGSGLDVLRKVKALNSSPVVIMLTVCSAREYKEKCKAFGADYFFEKSGDLAKMLTLLEKMAREERARISAG
jgi:DNA-binding NarL/FixJ family response regulator